MSSPSLPPTASKLARAPNTSIFADRVATSSRPQQGSHLIPVSHRGRPPRGPMLRRALACALFAHVAWLVLVRLRAPIDAACNPVVRLWAQPLLFPLTAWQLMPVVPPRGCGASKMRKAAALRLTGSLDEPATRVLCRRIQPFAQASCDDGSPTVWDELQADPRLSQAAAVHRQMGELFGYRPQDLYDNPSVNLTVVLPENEFWNVTGLSFLGGLQPGTCARQRLAVRSAATCAAVLAVVPSSHAMLRRRGLCTEVPAGCCRHAACTAGRLHPCPMQGRTSCPSPNPTLAPLQAWMS